MMYQCGHLLGWSLADFWTATPALTTRMLDEAAKALRQQAAAIRGKKPRRVIECRHADDIPEGAW